MENLEESGINEPVGSYYVEQELKEAQILIQEDYIYNKENSSKSAWIQPEIKGNEIMSTKYNEIIQLINSLNEDVEKFYVKGSAVAGTRLRKGLNELRNLAKEMREEIQDIKTEKKVTK